LRLREARRTERPDKLVAVIADPVFGPADGRMARASSPASQPPRFDLRRLQQTEKEARKILAFVPEEMGRAIVGFDAVPEVIKDPDLRHYRYLHFGTHGIVDAKQPELSGIVLSQLTPDGKPLDGILRFYDVYDLDLPVDLVSLSTCRSADGPQIRREGPITMTRSFFYAGASRVLGTLWEVSDRPAEKLTTAFYEGVLREGKRPAEALRDAQDAMRLDGWPPSTWAAFVLQGDWR
jgi:CHAT domain-containing protein